MIRKELRILLLSGGALAGAWQAGVLARRIEAGEDWDVIAGTGIGAFAAAYVFQSTQDHARDLRDHKNNYLNLWRGLESSRDLFSKRWFGRLNHLFGRSLYELSGMRKILDGVEILKLNNRTIRVGTTELSTGLHYTFSPDQDGFKEAVLASNAIPFLFEPVQIGDRYYLSGGLSESTPVYSVLDIIQNTNTTINITVIQCSTGNKAVAYAPSQDPVLDIQCRNMGNGDMEPVIKGTCGNNHRTVNVSIYRPLTDPVNVLEATGNELKLAAEKGHAEGDKPVKTFFI